jgi:predicted enzyme related to lactoylglutathione lyase
MIGAIQGGYAMVEMTDYAPGTPCWVDVSTPDMAATKAFYGGLFGWEATSYPEMGGYTNFTMHGKLICGAAPTMSPDQHPAWGTYICVANVDATAQAVHDNGGQVAMAPMDVADLGRMAIFQDPTGAFFGLWQPGQHKGAQLVNEPGSFGWNELDTRDMDAAKAFYTKVFPWTAKTEGAGAEAYTEWQLDGRSIAGGMVINESFPPDVPPNWLTYFVVANSDATVAKAKELGGTVVMSGMDTDQGRIAVIADPHGAVFATIQMKQ